MRLLHEYFAAALFTLFVSGVVVSGEPIRILGTVQLENKNVVPHATVTLIAEGLVSEWYANPVHVDVRSTKTDANGRFDLTVEHTLLSTEQRRFTLYASLDGVAIGWRHINQLTGEIRTELTLHQEKPLRGQLRDDSGEPIAGARIDLAGLFIGTTEAEPDVFKALVCDPGSAPFRSTMTDKNGRFAVAGLASDVKFAALRITHDGFNPILKGVDLAGEEDAKIVMPAADGVIMKGIAVGNVLSVSPANVRLIGASYEESPNGGFEFKGALEFLTDEFGKFSFSPFRGSHLTIGIVRRKFS